MDTQRLVAILNLPQPPGPFVERAGVIVERTTANPLFANATPTLAQLAADLAALRLAQINRLLGPAAMKARNAALRLMKRDLQQLRAFVQSLADADPEHAAQIIESAGLFVLVRSVHVKPDFEIRQGATSGTVTAHIRSRGPGATYWWELSTDSKVWTTFPPTRVANNHFANLTPGTVYAFRYQVLTAAGLSEWSQIVTFMVK